MKHNHKIFFAIPFDSATMNLYKRITNQIREIFPTVSTVIGTDEVGPSPKYSAISSFKAQNRELVRLFVEQIQSSDIVIADLTHNNPNVHVELGIALTENKNILRVTGRSLSELGFDIRNLDIFSYKEEIELENKIVDYLNMFFEIKKLPISNQYPQLYHRVPLLIPLQLRTTHGPHIDTNCTAKYLMRDGAVKVEFEIVNAQKPDDWFGLFFRSDTDPYRGSHFVYIRQNGMIEMAIYHHTYYAQFTVLDRFNTGSTIAGKHILTIQYENDYLEIEMGAHKFQTYKLSRQVFGLVLPVAWESDVDIHALEMVCRDTIDP